MNVEQLHSVYFIGVGGIGMSALARYFNANGVAVYGYDKTQTPLTAALQAEGIDIHFEDDVNQIPMPFKTMSEEVLVVYTPAIPKDHKEMARLKNAGHRLYKRSEVLGLITQSSFTIGVAGTHGKTTTSTIIAHMLKDAGYASNAFLGGIASNYNTNTLLDTDARATVVEADEFDRSFLTLHPDIAIVTSIDADHLDIYGDLEEMQTSFKLYMQQVKPEGLLVYKAGLPDIFDADQRVLRYGLTADAEVYADNITIQSGRYHFDLKTPAMVIENMSLGLAGLHNVENAVAAAAVGLELGLSAEAIKKAFHTFKGVKRRFEYHIQSDDLVYIDDYAHHPAELNATINSVREMYPDKKVTGIFQPHLFSRTRDFADEFAASLSQLNEVILLNIYPAREKPIEGIDSQFLLDKINNEHKLLVPDAHLVETLKERELEVLLTLGAGDIDQLVNPIKNALQHH